MTHNYIGFNLALYDKVKVKDILGDITYGRIVEIREDVITLEDKQGYNTCINYRNVISIREERTEEFGS